LFCSSVVFLYSSQVTEHELLDGEYVGQEKAVAEVRRVAYLAFSSAVRNLAKRPIDGGTEDDTGL